MNGVRRLAVVAAPVDKGVPAPIDTTMPLYSSNQRPNWPPMTPGDGSFSPNIQSSIYSPMSPLSPRSPDMTPAGLKILPRVPPPPIPYDLMQDEPPLPPPTTMPLNGRATAPLKIASSSRAAAPPERPPLKTNGPTGPRLTPPWSQTSSPVRLFSTLDTRDEMVISLLASDAAIDSRDMQVLSFDEVEELKKEQQALSSRVAAQTKKLALETKIRDAAMSLQNLNLSHAQVAKPTSDKLDAANRKVEAAQRELFKVSERANDVRRRLLEHRTAVLALSLRSLEAKQQGDAAQAHDRFDGAHLFAGNIDAVMLGQQDTRSDAAVRELEHQRAESSATIQELELQHARSSSAVQELEQQLNASKAREVKLESELDLAASEQDQLEQELRAELETANRRVEDLESRLDRALLDGNDSSQQQQELKDLQAKWDAERVKWNDLRAEWDDERAKLEEEKMDDLSRLQEEHETQREEDMKQMEEFTDARDAIQSIIRSNNIVTPISREPSMTSLVAAIAAHVDGMGRRMQDATDGQERLAEETGRMERELEAARSERELARKEAQTLEGRVRELASESRTKSPPILSMSPPLNTGDADLDRVLNALRGIWPMLPSPEARARKTGLKAASPMRPKSPVSPGGSDLGSTSLSDLDVRQLKALYDPRNAFPSPGVMGDFTVDAFVDRVQALLSDDRALIERLIRFAKSHEHLRTNAERAQKLAQESTMGLETYAKQMRGLEDRSTMLSGRTTELTNELSQVENKCRQAIAAQQAAEKTAAEMQDMCRTLREANESLSAKVSSSADPAQFNELNRKLKEAEDEFDRYRMVQETQRIALLDELNELQRDNSGLREQLRRR
ncbi:Up-regulated during septation-domain-containing protein [Auriculariales sp. MPI-PUGE-AT-0066]|nr:Up-regulated during septation-domain-containing protein [Auriculariales sp. MPI-PUGE-AT-0066]